MLFAVLLVMPSAAARAADVRYPPPPEDAAQALATFDDRSAVVTRHNACGREVEYSTYRHEQRNEDYEHQGEPLTTILVAKTAWLTEDHFRGSTCEYALDVPRPRHPDGTPVHPTPEEFMNATLGAWADPSVPTGCSWPTSQVSVTEDRLRVRVRVEPACLRQQVNEAIRAMVKDAQMGTDGLPCAASFSTGNKGDFDVNVRDIVRLFYMGTVPRREVLERSTIDHMYAELLAARGGLADDSYSILSDCDDPAGDELGSPEDYADRRRWYNELLSAIGDAFKWLAELHIRIAGAALASAAGVLGAPFFVAFGEDPIPVAAPHVDIRVPETENHRLMIEGSKYLTNQKIIEELWRIDHPTLDEIEEDQAEVRAWLLQTLRSIAIEDFEEYNSRPYTRYSLNAILNLYDFADDDALRTASQIVLDLSGAKFAAASNRGRRIVPFRRLADNDDRPLYEMVAGADHEIARALLYAGQSQLLDGRVAGGAVANQAYAAVSGYRWPRAVLEVAIERSGAFAQDVRHAGVEGYYASPSFTMSLGGVRRRAALTLLGIERSVDRGVAMPTVIIPTAAGLDMADLFRMGGSGSQHRRTDNLCGWQGFVCGIQPALSRAYLDCTSGEVHLSAPSFSFVNSAACPFAGDGPHFYLAAMRGDCDGRFCEAGRRYGLMEIVEAPNARPSPDQAFATFTRERRAALLQAVPDAAGHGTYVDADGRALRFRVHDQGSFLLAVDGTPRPEFATRGDVIDADGQGRVTIRSPWSEAAVDIDVTQWAAPVRVEAP